MILVTGGTGLVGSHLLWHLLDQGRKNIRAIYRSQKSLAKTEAVFTIKNSSLNGDKPTVFEDIEWIEADLNDLPALTQAFEGVTQVYHCAAMISFNPRHFKRLQQVNLEGTANVVNLCLALGVTKICYVSSIAALGDSKNHIDENTFWEPGKNKSVYSITKFAAEMEVWRGTQEGLPAVIVNPGLIIGEGDYDTGSGKIFKTIAKGAPFATTGSTAVVDVNDVALAMINLLESTILNQRFVLVSENWSYKQVFSAIARFLQKRPPRYELRPWQLKTIAVIDRFLALLGIKEQQIFLNTAHTAFLRRQYSNRKIIEMLHFKFTPVQESIERVAGHFKSSR